MKKMADVDGDALLKSVFGEFRSHFQAKLNGYLQKKRDPKQFGRIPFKVVKEGLEKSKEHLARGFDCREEILFGRAEPKKGSSWASLPKHLYNSGMREYLLDYSISHGAIPTVIGQPTKHPTFKGDEKYELLLAAESELGAEFEVARDLLKLLDVKARIKVLVYRARTRGLEDLKEKLEEVFGIHAHRATDAFWLVIGIPTYVHWHKYQRQRASTPRQVYVLRKNLGLHERNDWWSY